MLLKCSVLAVVIIIDYWHHFHTVLVQHSITGYQPEMTRVTNRQGHETLCTHYEAFS